MSPACGTAPPDQVEESDHRPSLTASCACVLTVKKAVASNGKKTKRLCERMQLSPDILALTFCRIGSGETNMIEQDCAFANPAP
jgi:hypothetical protein